LEYALKSIQIKKEIGSFGKLAVSQIAAANIYDKKGQHQKAISLFKEALTNAENTGYMEYIIKAHQGLSKAYSKTKNFEKAYHHQSLYVSYNDSVSNTENAEMINEMEKKFQSERKEQEIALLNKTNALKDVELAKASEESKRKSMQLYGSFVVGLILLVFAVVVVRNNQQRKKANEMLAQKNAEITKQKEIVEEQHQEITDSISYAKRIQTALLTSDNYWEQISKEHFVLLKPKDVVSGDFFWAFQTENNLAIWVAADCTGHGVPGAFMSMLGISFFNEIVVENNITNPAEILNKLRGKIIKALEQKGVDTQQKDGMDLALCVWDKNTNLLSFSGANNPLWLIRSVRHSGLDPESVNEIAGQARNDVDNWITSPLSKQLVHKWRSEESAIMIGTTTALNDNPQLNVREWNGKNPTRIVIDLHDRLPQSLNLFDKSMPTIVFSLSKENSTNNLTYVKINEAKTLLQEALNELYKCNIQSVIVEGGATLLQSFIDQHLWDEARVFVGNKKFTTGLKAPSLKGNLIAEELIDIDHLKWIVNN
jgi:riboflavin-specific deaminase-like protein